MPGSEIAWIPLLIQTLIAALISGSVVGIVLKALLDRKFEKERINREWKEKSLATLLGPVVMHLMRTDALSHLYQSTFNARSKSYFHAQLMRESNRAVRSLILANGHLIPVSLLTHAQEMIKHYDVWLARFDEKRALEKPDADSTFDLGFVEIRFPVAARDAFFEKYATTRQELYGVDVPNASFHRD